MQELEQRVQEVIENVQTTLSPVSIFLYGSRGRGDNQKTSDYEIGVMYRRDSKISRQALASIDTDADVNLYPHCYEDIIEGKVDTPFPPTLFLYELANGGSHTLSGEKVVESLPSPQIRARHVAARINFDIAMSLAAMLSARAGEIVTAKEYFYKSCLFGARCLSIVASHTFPLTYGDIAEDMASRDIGEYQDLIQKAYEVRTSNADFSELDIYKNIAFLTRQVRAKVDAIEDHNSILIG